MDREEFVKRLLGRPGRLRLAAWILAEVDEGGYFYQDQARQGTGDVPSEVRTNLENLAQLGAIKQAHRDSGPGRRQYYQRLASPVWQVFNAALVAVEALERGEAEPRLSSAARRVS